MHLSFISTRGQAGLDAPPITVEVHLSAGLPAFQVVGLGDSSSREIRSRVRAALISSHLKWPDFNITVNLTPAERVTPARALIYPLLSVFSSLPNSCRGMPLKAGNSLANWVSMAVSNPAAAHWRPSSPPPRRATRYVLRWRAHPRWPTLRAVG